MIVQDIIRHIEEIAPLEYAEDFDNVGLLVGDYNAEVSKVLVSLDALESVVEEALEKKCNLIVSFHPIIFSGLKKLNGKSYVERTVIKAIKNNIAIYAVHTALDNSVKGVSAKIAEIVGLNKLSILLPKAGLIKKLTTYVPEKDAEKVRKALHKAGAGAIGNYEACSFSMEGKGTFKAGTRSKPAMGKKGKLHREKETFISVIFERHLENQVLAALMNVHPYEEVAYDIITTDNTHQHIGMGMIGDLPRAMPEKMVFEQLKTKFRLKVIRHSPLLGKSIKKIAVLGGSGSFAIEAAIGQKADLYITSDLKYHDFFKADGKVVLADIGHFESEQFTKNLLVDHLTKKFRNFAIILSEKNTNPINYF